MNHNTIWIRWIGIDEISLIEVSKEDRINTKGCDNLEPLDESSRFIELFWSKYLFSIYDNDNSRKIRYNSGKIRDGNICKLIRRVLLHIHMYISSLSQKALGKENGTVDYSSRSRDFSRSSSSSTVSSSHWHDYSRSSYLPLAPVPVMVRVMINDRVEFVLFPGTLALSPHVFTKFTARHRALFVLYTPVNKRKEFERASWSWQIGISITHNLSAREK